MDEEAKNIVDEFVQELSEILEENPDGDVATCFDPDNPIRKALEGVIEDYYYFDDSTEHFPGGKPDVKGQVSAVLCGSIREISNVETTGVGPVREPSYVPEELEEVQVVASVSFLTPSDPEELERDTVKINGKWYIRAVYVSEGEIHFYPEDDLFF